MTHTTNRQFEESQQEMERVAKVSGSLVSPAGAIVLICFVVPWLSVSCSGIPVIDQASGMDLVMGVRTGIPWEGPIEFPGLLLIVLGAAIAFVAGLALTADLFLFKGRYSSLASSAAAVAGFGLVAATWFGFMIRLAGFAVQAEQEGVPLDVTTHFGLWGVVLFASAGVVAAILGSCKSFTDWRQRRRGSSQYEPPVEADELSAYSATVET